MSDSIKVICRNCDRATTFSKDAIISEIKRLSIYNYEILTCTHCQHKFSKYDFECSLGIKIPLNKPELTQEDIEKIEAEHIRVLAEQLLEAKAKEDEIKKMQAGESFNPIIVGEVEMENGTPNDRRCVRILRTEGEIYAYSFLAINRILTFITNILTLIGEIITKFTDFIWDIIKKINWCIVCSISRIGYFIGYVVLILYGVCSIIIFNKPIFEFVYHKFVNDSHINTPIYSYASWTCIVIVTFTVPLLLQLIWAFGRDGSRWSKVIRKRIDEIVK